MLFERGPVILLLVAEHLAKFLKILRDRETGGPSNSAQSRGGSGRAGCGRVPPLRAVAVRARNHRLRAKLSVMRPSAWPVSTGGADGAGAARKSKAKPRSGSSCPGRVRQIKPQDRVEQTVFRDLDLAPARQVLRNLEIGDGPVVATSRAERFRTVGQHHPVADLVLVILAEPIAIGRIGQCIPAITIRLERAHHAQLGQVAEAPAAAVTSNALEIERLLAILAFE